MLKYRTLKIIKGLSGSKNETYKISIPTEWVRYLYSDISINDKFVDVRIELEENRIIIEKKPEI